MRITTWNVNGLRAAIRKGFQRRTIERIEFEVFTLPRPSLVVLLDVPVEIAQRNIAAKKPRNYTDKAADLQEADASYLQRVRDVYLQLASTEPNWRRVESARDGQQRSIAEIGDDILNQVRSALRCTARG